VKALIAAAFFAAGGCAVLSYAGVLPAANLAPPILFGSALILVLLHLMYVSDRRY
jgi:hypothetical protein